MVIAVNSKNHKTVKTVKNKYHTTFQSNFVVGYVAWIGQRVFVNILQTSTHDQSLPNLFYTSLLLFYYSIVNLKLTQTYFQADLY